jgi:hypothetical protein
LVGGGGGGLGDLLLNIFFAKSGIKTQKIATKWENMCKLFAGTENDKHDNNEIIKIENSQENAEKHVTWKFDTFYRDGQTDTYL